jgi:hypothetical protein
MSWRSKAVRLVWGLSVGETPANVTTAEVSRARTAATASNLGEAPLRACTCRHFDVVMAICSRSRQRPTADALTQHNAECVMQSTQRAFHLTGVADHAL